MYISCATSYSIVLFLSPSEGTYRRSMEEAERDFLSEIPVQPISLETASVILSYMAEDTPLVTTVWPYTDFAVWDIETLKPDSIHSSTIGNVLKQNKSDTLLNRFSFPPNWRENKFKNASISRDSALRIGGRMKDGIRVKVEVYTHFDRRPTHDVFGIVRGAVEPGKNSLLIIHSI